MTDSVAPQPPKTENELLERAGQLTGNTLRHLSELLNVDTPENPVKAKGWIGECVELFLGATAGPLPEPDFREIGVELKTLPLNSSHRPKESTYVCTVPLVNLSTLNWENSTVKKKLNRVLWVPVEADNDIPFAERRFGNAFLWSPDSEQIHELKSDWEEIMEMISTGELHRITSDYGKVLQIRPKGMNSKALTRSVMETGESGLTLPRGFYLRTSFTNEILVRSEEKRQ